MYKYNGLRVSATLITTKHNLLSYQYRVHVHMGKGQNGSVNDNPTDSYKCTTTCTTVYTLAYYVAQSIISTQVDVIVFPGT